MFTVLLHPVIVFYSFESASCFPRAPPKTLKRNGNAGRPDTRKNIPCHCCRYCQHCHTYATQARLPCHSFFKASKKRYNEHGVAATFCCKEGGGKTNADCFRHHLSNMRHTHSRYYAQSGHIRHEQNMSKNTCSYESAWLDKLRNMWKACQGMTSKATRTADE